MRNIRFKENIKRLLCERGLKQKDIAKITKLTKSAISKYINGDRMPDIYNLVRLAEALNVSIDYLIFGR